MRWNKLRMFVSDFFFAFIDNRSREINQQSTVILKGNIWRIDHYYFIVIVFSNLERNSALKKMICSREY